MYTVREGRGRDRKREGEREGREGGRGEREGRVGGRGEREGVERGWEGGGGRERSEGGSIQCSGNINYSFYIVNGKTHFSQLIHILSFTSSLT